MKVHLKKLSQKDIEERKANYDVFVEIKDKKKTKMIKKLIFLIQMRLKKRKRKSIWDL